MKNTKKRILWVSPLIFDLSFHRTAQLEVVARLEKNGHNVFLLGMRSRATFKFQKYSYNDLPKPPRLLQVPIRYVSMIAPAIYALVMMLLVPITIFSFNPDFVIFEKGMLMISSIPSIILSKFRRAKFILDIRSVPVEVEGFYGAFHKFWYKARNTELRSSA